ncbi:MAG: hypothetical protein EZS28_016765, partial [Streblomastix strix]
MNKNKHNINLLTYLLVFSSICGIFNVSAINGITQDNGISSSTLNSASSNPFSLQNANKTDINSYMVNTSGFTQSSKLSNDDIQFYISSNGNDDSNDCFSDSPCKTINHILTIEPPSGFDRDSNSAIINLKSNSSDQTGISLNSGTNLAINIIIQSEEYIQSPAEYQKYSILTSLKTSTLFTIENIQQLKLLGLHFDNLNPSSTATTPLILISQTNNRENPQVTIKDCIFEQINLEANLLNHTIVKVSGGHFIVENTLIQNYEFINGQRFIELGSSGYYLIDIVNTEFKNINQDTSNQQGGAVISGNLNYGNILRIRDQCKFTNITSNGNGGAICITGESGTTEISGSTFIRCKGRSGGALYASRVFGASITINNQCYFKDCESNSQNEEDSGGAIFIVMQINFGQFYIGNSQFDGCKGNNNRGGAIHIILSGSHIGVIEEVQFLNCQGNKGGAIDIQTDFSQISVIKSKFNSCFSTFGPGGAIRCLLTYDYTDSTVLIENTQFESCSSNSDGGSVFAQINHGILSLNKVTFIGSSCTQPGSGGAIAIVQQNSYSRISLKDSSFTNCKTLPGSSSQYGWGGAIYIFTLFPATELSSINFQLTDLSFQECSAFGAGNNFHIRSLDTYNTGIAIAANTLVTVKDLSDLYTNEQYSNDYMGIDESKVSDGNTQISDHQALFLAAQQEFITKEYYIRSSDSLNENDCSSSSPCKTINNILSKLLPTGFVKGLSISIINLLSETSDQTNIIISSENKHNNIITIQSDGYMPRGTDYIKRQIQTSSKTQSLFTISDTGRLKLFGLHFDNLNPFSTATTPLIQISESYDRENPQVTIKDCIFEQINPELNSLSHTLIITSGGTLLIENTIIQNYEFINGYRFIDLGSSGQYLVDIVNSEFKNIHQDTSNQQGGAVISGSQIFGNILRIRDQCKFNNITSTGQGGAIYCTGRQLVIEINRVSFINCKGRSGGAIFATSEDTMSLTIDNQSEFKQCETFNNNEELGGGAIYLMTERWGFRDIQFNIRNSIFEECKSNNLEGGAILIKILIFESTCVIDGVQFINCQGSGGGAINQQSERSQITINGSSSFTSCSSLSNPGGAIHSILNNGGSTLIENTQFESCNSANSDGGSIFAQINYGSLIINQVTFIGSSCIQPGSGGAIAIVQQNSNSRISITESSFTNCQTLPGSSSQYGWGGAIDIEMGFEASFLTLENFQLTDLSFTNCKASGAGNNVHILSMDTYATGQVIKNENLLTVKDQSNQPNIIYDLYTSPQYAYDYMGINESIETDNPGTIDLDHHNPLFEQLFISKVPNPSYIDAINGKDIKFCGGQYQMCKTIKYSTERNPTPLSEIIPTDSTYSIILTSNTALDTNIQIMSTTLLNGYVIIQADGYNSIEDYTKQSILTSSFSSSLFTITETGHLELLGLRFDSLNPSSTATTPLILISQSDDKQIPEVIIKDCIFEQINPESISLNHTIVKVSGGHFIVENTLIQNYGFINAQRVIELIGSGQYQVDVINSEFKNISQVGTSRDDGGAVIKSDQDPSRNFMVKDCIFSDICTDGNGGAINSAGWYGTTQVYGTIFTRCFGRHGGAFYANKAISAYITIDDCEFKDCESNSQNEDLEALGGGGAVCIIFQIYGCELLIRNCLFDSCKGNNNKGGALHMTLTSSVSVIDGVEFKNCQGLRGGAISYVGNDNNNLNINGSSSFTSCSSQSNPGGAIHSILNNGGSALFDNTQFESCNCTNFDGGSIFVQINNGILSINKVTFIGSSCSQPGSGGAIAIVQQNSNSRISITESSFTNCQTLPGSSKYGWGGAIYIFTSIPATELSSTNFQFTDLSFQQCLASGTGNNLHIRSPNTYNTGIAIAANSLVTVKDLSDLYTNEQYSNDYMGIDESMVSDGNTQISDHQALFLAAQQEFITKEYYIRSSDSLNENDCSSSSPCKTIDNILSQSLPTGFVKGLSISIINLLSETSDQTNIIISSETELNNIITIQSDGYQSEESYNKQSILTSLFDTTLFTISDTGRLKLLGLHFDNLNPSSTVTNPLIQISESYDRQNPQVMIKDCIFEQINPQSNSLSHSIIITSGGTLLIENTIIQNYEFINGQRVIDLGSSAQYLVDIVNSEFKNLHQDTGNQQGGAIIYGSLGYGALLRIRDQCKFTNISSTGQGGAICCTGYYVVIEINRVSFIECKGISGGAIFATSEDTLSLTIDNQSEFKQCEIIGNNEEQGGGAIYLFTQRWGFDNQINFRNSIFEECKSNNLEGGAILIKILSFESTCVIDGVQFINCQGSGGGAINYQSQDSQITIKGSSSFTSCSSISNPGGAIHSILILGEILIESAQFESCSSISDGGSIFAQIYYGGLIINQVTFVGSSCIQPGSGGAIAIVQQNSYSRISITESSFTNCQTLPGSSSQYGWGGAIDIEMGFEASFLTLENFQLTDLSFQECSASGAGNNLHILSDDTTAVGNQIKTGSLVTVKDMSNLPNIISDLYTNE